MPNRLAAESSPYLLQHKDNPVDWYPWGEEALTRAREEDRPLLVSIGYSACHWCHVMAHESFEDPAIAALMNERLVCVKVDREERPDVDAICMEACQAMTGHGGWPLNAFLTPEGVPFYAGTYFPPESRHGLPSWRIVLDGVTEAWANRREEIREQGSRIVDALSASQRIEPSPEPIRGELIDQAVDSLRASYDRVNGGFGGAVVGGRVGGPKFPPASVIELLLARGEREMSLGTLAAMARGGIYDQIGGGFARYSVDATWTVPHFEKMLYDNALLARAYLHGWQVFGQERFRRVCHETLDWALREMRGPEGGFCSALDADSEGVEGKFYVWTLEELRDALGPDLEPVALDYFRPRPFEHRLILEGRGPEPTPGVLGEIQRRLLQARSGRVRPGLDDKRLTSWNALMISALAEAGAVLERPDYVEAAIRCASFVLSDLRDPDGRLLRTWKDGRGRIAAYLEDHAYLLEALIGLYEATGDPRWFAEARKLADVMVERFSDAERGGFFTTATDHEDLAARRKDLEDTPIPSGNSAAAFGLLRLGLLAGEGSYESQAVGVLRLLFGLAVRHPHAFGHLLQAADFYLAPVKEVAIVGPEPEADELVRVVRGAFRPHLVLATGEADGVPLLAGREAVEGHAAAYVCERFVCLAPVTSPEALAAAL
ncbi:MAG TPA: thioredoxin domain-containing protein [Solirubrobacteraceae bacterium]|nr:thioredoxin domain-containing protein [Solirubrobacteraceae bacterium]